MQPQSPEPAARRHDRTIMAAARLVVNEHDAILRQTAGLGHRRGSLAMRIEALRDALGEAELIPIVRPTVAACLEAVAQEFAVPVPLLLSDRRSAWIALPRQVAMHLAIRLTGRSTPEIGRALRRDHSTVLHGHQAVRARLLTDPELAARVEALAAALTTTPERSEG